MKGFALGICLTLLTYSVAANASGIPFSMTHVSQKRIKDDPPPPPPPGPSPNPDPKPIVDDAPTLELQPQYDGNIGAWIHVKSNTNCSDVQWFSPDDNLNIFPQEQLKDATSTIVSSLTPGTYKLFAYTGNSAGITRPVMTMIVIHGAQPPPQPPPRPAPPVPPVPPPVPPAPPSPPAPATAAKLWIVVLDNAVSRSPQAAAILTDINLRNALQAQGHTLEELNLSMPRAQLFKQQVNVLGGVPCVVILDPTKTKGNWLNQNPQDMRMPDSAAGFQALVAKYSGH